jgi:hypothetical protein
MKESYYLFYIKGTEAHREYTDVGWKQHSLNATG